MATQVRRLGQRGQDLAPQLGQVMLREGAVTLHRGGALHAPHLPTVWGVFLLQESAAEHQDTE